MLAVPSISSRDVKMIGCAMVPTALMRLPRLTIKISPATSPKRRTPGSIVKVAAEPVDTVPEAPKSRPISTRPFKR